MDDVRSLVERAGSTEGNPDERVGAFGELVRPFQDMGVGYTYSALGDFHLAEDAAQEAFITAHR
jgi:DNA-directed RNA polymerase specialized sigma24 family protein